jgi:hypothetical protein
MEYREVEAWLARLHHVDEEGAGAFRARLRVLRDLGIPKMPKVGKGARVHFSKDDIAELHLALTMSEFGLAPSRIAKTIEIIRNDPDFESLTLKGDYWLVLTMRANAGKLSDVNNTEAILSLATRRETELVEFLKEPPADTIATWHAVLSLQRVAKDMEGIDA